MKPKRKPKRASKFNRDARNMKDFHVLFERAMRRRIEDDSVKIFVGAWK